MDGGVADEHFGGRPDQRVAISLPEVTQMKVLNELVREAGNADLEAHQALEAQTHQPVRTLSGDNSGGVASVHLTGP